MRRLRVPAFATVAAIVVGCASFKSTAAYYPCNGQPCTLTIQNDAAVDVAARYADTTGHNDVIGMVRSGNLGVFRLQWIRSASLRILVTTRDGEHYHTSVRLVRAGPIQIHFPADFKLVELKSDP